MSHYVEPHGMILHNHGVFQPFCCSTASSPCVSSLHSSKHPCLCADTNTEVGGESSCLFVLFHFAYLLWHFALSKLFLALCLLTNMSPEPSLCGFSMVGPLLCQEAYIECHLLPFQSHSCWSARECKKWSHHVTPQWEAETWHRGFVFPVCQLPPKECHLKRGSLLTMPRSMEQANSSCDLPAMLLLFPGLEVLLTWQMSNVWMLYIHPSCRYLGELWLESTRNNCGCGLV